MKLSKKIVTILLNTCLAIIILPSVLPIAATAQTQDSRIALQRGYRTGYSDGYMAGYRDTIDSMARDYARHNEYAKGERAYSKDYGTLEDYRDGYQQGFESGYDTGFEKRSFEPTLPVALKRRGQIQIPITNQDPSGQASNPPVKNNPATSNTDPAAPSAPIATSNALVIIPNETELIVELQNDMSTQNSREGEKFTARVVSPAEIAGAIIEGRISKIRQPGRIKRRSELLLSFDRILLSDSRWSNFSAVMTEVMPVKGDNIKLVDNEGTAIGQGSLKSDGIKIGTAAGTGLIIGAIAGGPVGAAVGASVGAAFGVGAVVVERGKQIRLNRNQQVRIKTAHETQIR